MISLIVCTRDRAASLEGTLRAFDSVDVPFGCEAELIVVDNASVDHTAAVVHQAQLRRLDIRYVQETKPGLSLARNAGLARARGSVLLFTDDDVVPARDWMERLAQPLLLDQCDGVVGGVHLAEHLQRPWMNQTHKNWLAAQHPPQPGEVQLVGANMGFLKAVLERIPGFDPELGAGALGFGEDTLFSMQMAKAGYRLQPAFDARVVHHLSPSRLLRSSWLSAALKHGATSAYLLHHWRHGAVDWPMERFCYLGCKLLLRRLLQPPPRLCEEGCPPWELSYVTDMARFRHFIRERRRPRNYAKHGLTKLPHPVAAPHE